MNKWRETVSAGHDYSVRKNSSSTTVEMAEKGDMVRWVILHHALDKCLVQAWVLDEGVRWLYYSVEGMYFCWHDLNPYHTECITSNVVCSITSCKVKKCFNPHWQSEALQRYITFCSCFTFSDFILFFLYTSTWVKDKCHRNPLKSPSHTFYIPCTLFKIIIEVQKSFNFSPVRMF